MCGANGAISLQATAIGCRVWEQTRDGPVDARVLGVFQRAFSAITGDGWVFAAVGRQWPGPASVVVPGLRTALAGRDVGSTVRFSRESIVLPEGGLCINLRGAPIWAAPAVPAGPPAAGPARHANVATAAALCRTAGRERGLAALLPALAAGRDILAEPEGEMGEPGAAAGLLGLARPAIGGLVGSLAQGRLDRAGACAAHLVGLGPGLTPSGDDFLAGLLLALGYAGRTREVRELAGSVAAQARGGTTAVSEQQLRLAAQGQADEVVAQAAIAVLWDVQPVEGPIRTLLELGSTSGGDWLTGICVASEIIGRI